ncbi:MAG TPA: hypothetical protein VFX15_15235 [Actinomycetes bacterium]|nr:hypothetical protein [Actinomycetes bacterium]
MTEEPTDGPKNKHLGATKNAKNREFYTQWADVKIFAMKPHQEHTEQ